MLISLDRDSVHAGDDAHSHEASIEIEGSATLRALFNTVQGMGYLPSISGGDATWIIYSSEKALGVLAQQWSEAELTVPADRLVGEYFGNTEPCISFRYWCQKDPGEVFALIQSGEEPPPRYG